MAVPPETTVSEPLESVVLTVTIPVVESWEKLTGISLERLSIAEYLSSMSSFAWLVDVSICAIAVLSWAIWSISCIRLIDCVLDLAGKFAVAIWLS